MLAADDDVALVAMEDADRPLGAIWCHQHEPALLQDNPAEPFSEMIVAVCPEDRNQGVGTQLIEELVDAMRQQTAAVVLNVHLLNPAARLYIRAGFCVAGCGRGIYGVAMTRVLS